MRTSTLHQTALALLARAPLSTNDLALLESATPLAEWLWKGAQPPSDSGCPPITQFLESLERLLPLAEVSHQPGLVVSSLLCVGQEGFFKLPGEILTLCVRHFCAAETPNEVALAKLEVAHVVHWVLEAGSPLKSTGGFRPLVDRAQAWRGIDEIDLRRNMLDWEFPLSCDIGFSVCDLTPITSTRQLVESLHHKGILCNVARRQALMTGQEVWMFATPRMAGAAADICLLGLHRSDNGAWGTPEVYGPGEARQFLGPIALAIAAREKAAHLRQRFDGAYRLGHIAFREVFDLVHDLQMKMLRSASGQQARSR